MCDLNNSSSKIRVSKFGCAVQSDLQAPRRPAAVGPGIGTAPARFTQQDLNHLFEWLGRSGCRTTGPTPEPRRSASESDLMSSGLLELSAAARASIRAETGSKIDEKKTTGHGGVFANIHWLLRPAAAPREIEMK